MRSSRTVATPAEWALVTQRTAGNAALSGLLASYRPVIQRDPKTPDPAAVKAAEDAKAVGAMKKAFTFPFWELPEGKGARPGTGGAYVTVDGIRVRFLADRFLSEEEFAASGTGTFISHGMTAAAVTQVFYDHLDFDPKTVRTSDLGTGQFMVTDYAEPVLTVSVQTTYRKHRKVASLESARAGLSGYGKGRTLQDHEAAHVADAVAFFRERGPRLANGRGTEAASFNQSVLDYYAAARNVSADFGAYSQARTDCPGVRNAVFCPARKRGK